MTVAADLAHVVALACVVDDRTDGEQAALVRVAQRLDAERNRLTVSNRRLDRRQPLQVRPGACVHGPGCKPCAGPVDGEHLAPVFTDRARAEPLVDRTGWSIAEVIVERTRP